MNITKGVDNRWYKNCPSCNKPQSYLRKNYAEESLRLGKECKACSNKHVENCHRGWHRGVRISWFNKFKLGAELRGLDWTLTIDDVADVYDKQNGLCALTDESIVFPEVGHPQNAIASIDRIDSAKGYVKENIQLVTKQVNMMKQAYSQELFIQTCMKVAKKFAEIK
jgi:hypothetical protein